MEKCSSEIWVYLDFWDNGALLCTGAGEGRQRGRRHDRVGAGEAAQVTTGNLILLVPHDDGFHDEEAIPRQPEGVLLCDKGGPLEPQDDGDAAVGDQVKAVWEGRVRRRGAAVEGGKGQRKEEKLYQRVSAPAEGDPNTSKTRPQSRTVTWIPEGIIFLKAIHHREFAKTK